jgi:hypothetical protein
MTTAGLHRTSPGSVPPPAAGTRRGRAAAGWRLARLYLVSRRVPMALALLAGLSALLWAALHWHWNIAGGAAARLFIPLTIQTGAAAVIAVTTYGPFGEPERATGRWLPWLRLGVAVALTAVAFGALAAGAAAGGMPGGTLALLRNLGGMAGIGLLSAAILGGAFGWTGRGLPADHRRARRGSTTPWSGKPPRRRTTAAARLHTAWCSPPTGADRGPRNGRDSDHRASRGPGRPVPRAGRRASALRGAYAIRRSRGGGRFLPSCTDGPRRAAAGVQVVHEQCGHERRGRGGLEDLHAEPVRARVRRGQHPVLHHRLGARRRGDVQRHYGPAVAGERGPPPLQPFGQRVVGALLGDQAVVDAGVGAGQVGAAQQPPARQRPQRPPGQFAPRERDRRRGPTARPRRRSPRTRRLAWPGRRAPGRPARPGGAR